MRRCPQCNSMDVLLVVETIEEVSEMMVSVGSYVCSDCTQSFVEMAV